jgi:hypothetical protein
VPVLIVDPFEMIGVRQDECQLFSVALRPAHSSSQMISVSTVGSAGRLVLTRSANLPTLTLNTPCEAVLRHPRSVHCGRVMHAGGPDALGD